MNKNALDRFRVRELNPKISCYFCGKEMTPDKLSTFKVSTYDANRHYRGSNRKIISNYKMKLCPICFKKTMEKFSKIILEIIT